MAESDTLKCESGGEVMQRDVMAVAVISVMLGVFAVIVSGTPSGAFFVCLFIGGAICLFRER